MKLTLLIIAINVIVFIASLANIDHAVQNFGFSVDNLLAGKIYVVVTSMFIHGSISHLFFNMLALFFLGWSIEKCVSKWQYLVVYFISGMAGSLLILGISVFPFSGYASSTLAIGASGAIAGIVGFGAFICPTKFVLFEFIPLPFIAAGALFLVLNISGLFIPSNIAYPAHIGGMVVGAAFGMMWGENRRRNLIIFIFVTFLIFLSVYLLSVLFA